MKPRWEVPNTWELEACVGRRGGSLPRKSGLVLEGTPPFLNFHIRTRIPDAAHRNLNSCFWLQSHWLESLERVLEHWSLTKAAQGIPVYSQVESSVMENVDLIYMHIEQSFLSWTDEDLFSQNSLSGCSLRFCTNNNNNKALNCKRESNRVWPKYLCIPHKSKCQFLIPSPDLL